MRHSTELAINAEPRTAVEAPRPVGYGGAIGWPLLVTFLHALVYTIHRDLVGSLHKGVPIEFVSFVIFLVALNIVMFPRATSLAVAIAGLCTSVASFFLVGPLAFVLLVLSALFVA